MYRFIWALTRKKSTSSEEKSQLARVLTLLDLTGLGVGSTLGLGVYVLAGAVSRTVAGPAVCLSFLIAAIASAFAGLCYAEFAARVPKAGSAYVYSYVSVGEFVAYIIGWNLVLEYIIGTAGVARGLSNYIDALSNNTMRAVLSETVPIHIGFLAPYPDFLSFLLVALMTILLASGVKESTTLNNIFTGLNLTTVVIVIVAGSLKADVKNWQIPKSSISANVTHAGEGGFMPFGISGVMAGAAKCFFGFVGFDCIATTGEEAKNPKKNIPLSIVFSLIIIFLAYFGVSTVLTMMWPYYDQNADAPFPYVFEQVGWYSIKWIVSIGAIFALCTSLLGAMFPLPRIFYAMSNDGLLFTFLAKVNEKTKTPLRATLIAGFCAGVMAMIFDLNQLIDMMSIGTLLAYTIVAICVLILRYEDDDFEPKQTKLNDDLQNVLFAGFKNIFNLNNNKRPTLISSSVVKWTISLFSILSLSLCCYVIYGFEYINYDYPICLWTFIVIAIFMIMTVIIIARQPISNKELSFKVPWVPIIPCLSILINFYLMVELDLHTWIRFTVWLLLGFLIYFFYGISHSVENRKKVQVADDLKVTKIKNSESKEASKDPTMTTHC